MAIWNRTIRSRRRSRLRHRPARPRAVGIERLERRTLLSGTLDSYEIQLETDLDAFGFQPVLFQAYEENAAFSIFDTGASVITFSSYDQFLFDQFGGGIPIKVPGGAVAQGIGGVLTGDVSEPGTITADGLHVSSLNIADDGFPDFSINFDANSASVPGVQAFVGTLEGSEILPTITGTPMLVPTDANPNGLAVRIDPEGELLDFSDLAPGLVIPVPSVRFQQAGLPLESTESIAATAAVDDPAATATSFVGVPELLDIDDLYNGFFLRFETGDLAGEMQRIADFDGETRTFTFDTGFSAAPADGDLFDIVRFSTDPLKIDLEFFGIDNHLDPGDMITAVHNPVHNGVAIEHGGVALADQTFLFDTGAQLTTISVDQAIELGFDLDNPERSIAVQGAAGVVSDIPGYTMDRLAIPTSTGGELVYHDVPVYVVDVAAEIGGLLGMNLFNRAASIVYDPYGPGGPSAKFTFFQDHVVPDSTGGLDPAAEQLVEMLFPPVAGAIGLKGVNLPGLVEGVDLDLVPDSGVVSVQGRNTIVTVPAGSALGFAAEVASAPAGFDRFQLDFGTTAADLGVGEWVVDPSWTADDGTLSLPADVAVSGTRSTPATTPTTLGRFDVTVPETPGDYVLSLTAQDDRSEFVAATGERLPIRDLGRTILRVVDVPQVLVSDVVVEEGDASADAQVTVRLSNPVAGAVLVDFATVDGTAVAGEDYASTAGTLEFPAGVTERTIPIPVIGDDVGEANEAFSIAFSNPRVFGTVDESNPVADGTGIDGDGDAVFESVVETGNLEVNGVDLFTGGSSRAAMEFALPDLPPGSTLTSATLSLSEVLDETAFPELPGIEFPTTVLGYAGDGAIESGDMTAAGSSITTFGDGVVDPSVEIDVTDYLQSLVGTGTSFVGFRLQNTDANHHVHSAEAVDPAARPSLRLEFRSAIGLPENSATVTLANDDAALSVTGGERSEGDAANVGIVFSVELDHASTQSVSVDYTVTDGTASAASADFHPVTGTLTFEPDETLRPIVVPVVGDHRFEEEETFSLVLSNPVNAAIADGTAEATILDDDSPAVAAASDAVRFAFGDAFDPGVLNGFDSDDLGPRDFALVGETVGPVAGSLVLSADGRSATFVPTGGPLPPDEYTFTLRGAADAFHDAGAATAAAQSLGGDSEFGGDFAHGFTIAEDDRPVVGLPDFARGPGQPIDVGGTAGLPVTISDGTGVTTVTVDVDFDPQALSVADAVLADHLPAGTAITAFDTSTPGTISITITAPAPLGAGPHELVRLVGGVPETAPPGATRMIDVRDVSLNGGAIAAAADDAVQAVALPGDTTGDGAYGALDAQRVLRIAVGLDAGFAGHPLLDPAIVGDVTGDGVVGTLDAARLLRVVVGLDDSPLAAGTATGAQSSTATFTQSAPATETTETSETTATDTEEQTVPQDGALLGSVTTSSFDSTSTDDGETSQPPPSEGDTVPTDGTGDEDVAGDDVDAETSSTTTSSTTDDDTTDSEGLVDELDAVFATVDTGEPVWP